MKPKTVVGMDQVNVFAAEEAHGRETLKMSLAGIKEQRPCAAAAMLHSRTTDGRPRFTPIQSIIRPPKR
jgi:hypothetical protein